MNVTRHWLAYRTDTWGTEGAPVVLDGEARVTACREAGLRVEGPFSLNDSGAVDALREIKEIASRPMDTPAEDFYGRCVLIATRATTALGRSGGQSAGTTFEQAMTGQYVSLVDIERLLSDTSRHFAGAHVNADVAVADVSRRLRKLVASAGTSFEQSSGGETIHEAQARQLPR